MPNKRFIKPYKKSSPELKALLEAKKIISKFKFRITEDFLQKGSLFRKGQLVASSAAMMKVLLSKTNNYVKIKRIG